MTTLLALLFAAFVGIGTEAAVICLWGFLTSDNTRTEKARNVVALIGGLATLGAVFVYPSADRASLVGSVAAFAALVLGSLRGNPLEDQSDHTPGLKTLLPSTFIATAVYAATSWAFGLAITFTGVAATLVGVAAGAASLYVIAEYVRRSEPLEAST